MSVPAAGTPVLLDSPEHIAAAGRALAAGTGPIAIDTERASAFRYDDRAFVIQLRRRGTETFLIDPEAEPSATRRLSQVVNQSEWVLHAAHTDLPCLLALGWTPPAIHDTQVAAQILGKKRIGLSAMLEDYFDIVVPKDKGNADWSRRPLSPAMLNYAALDVEWLVELSETALNDVADAGRIDWYTQECAHILATATPLAYNDWTGLKGLNSVRRTSARKLAHDLWEKRDQIARQRDISPESILRSRDLISIAGGAEDNRAAALRELKMSLRRSRAHLPSRTHKHFIEAFSDALSSAPSDLEMEQYRAPQYCGPRIPDHKLWPEEFPRAAAYADAILNTALDLADALEIRLDTIATRKNLRKAAWACWLFEDSGEYPNAADPIACWEELLGDSWAGLGLRPWQVELLLDAAVPAVADVFARSYSFSA